MTGITEVDKEIAFDYIILNILLLALEKDVTTIENSNLKFKNIYAQFLMKTHQQISNDLMETKRIMKTNGIKVLDKTVVGEEFWSYKYFVRGYEAEFRCLTYALKMHSEKKLTSYYSLQE